MATGIPPLPDQQAGTSLSQVLKGTGGQLQTTSTTGVANLSAALGMPAPTITPAGTSAIPGTNPDMAKMAGTAAQKGNALRLSIQGSQDLGTTEREQQSRTNGTAGEQNQLTLQKALSQMGGLEARVPAMTNNMISAATAAAAGNQALSAGNQTLNSLVSKIISNPNDYTSAQGIAAQLKIPAPTDQVTMGTFLNTIQGMIPGMAEQIAGAALANQQQMLVPTEADWQSLGFAGGSTEVAGLIGVSATALKGMTISQVIDAVQAEIYRDFTQVNTLQTAANDPNVGAVERAEARAQLKDLGAVGVTAATAGVDKLADDLVSAKSVKIGDETFQLSDLLNSNYVTGLAKSYLEGDTTFKTDFQKSEPDLAKFFDAYSDSLTSVVGQVDTGMQNYANLQMQVTGMARTSNGDVLSDDIMKEIIPNWGSADGYTSVPVINSPTYDALTGKTGLTQLQVGDLYSNITWLQGVNPTLVTQLFGQGVTEAQLQAAGLTDKTSAQFKSFQNNVLAIQNLSNLKSTGAPLTADQAARVVGASGESQLASQLEQAQTMLNSGLFQLPAGANFGALTVDSITSGAQALMDNLPTDLAGVIGFANSGAGQYGQLTSFISQPASQLWTVLSPYLTTPDAEISADQAGQIISQVDNPSLAKLIALPTFGSIFTSDAQDAILSTYKSTYVHDNIQPILQKYTFNSIDQVLSTSMYYFNNRPTMYSDTMTKGIVTNLNDMRQLQDSLTNYIASNSDAQVGPMASVLKGYQNTITRSLQLLLDQYNTYIKLPQPRGAKITYPKPDGDWSAFGGFTGEVVNPAMAATTRAVSNPNLGSILNAGVKSNAMTAASSAAVKGVVQGAKSVGGSLSSALKKI